MLRSKLFTVSGLVQGVWFRAFTAEQANRIGVCGWVRNTNDGKVELLACGEEEKLKQLEQELWKGSELSRVDSVESQDSEEKSEGDFVIRW